MADSDVELPPPVLCSSSDEDDLVSLPPSVGEEDADISDWFCPKCACGGCSKKFAEEDVKEMRAALLRLKETERQAKHFMEVHALMNGGTTWPKKANYVIKGLKVCRTFWEHANCIGAAQLDKVRNLIKAGHSSYPASKRSKLRIKIKEQHAVAEDWFLELYLGLLEPLPQHPDTRPEEDDPYELVVLDADTHPLWRYTIAINAQHKIPVRFMTEGTFADLYRLHRMETGVKGCSRSTLQRAWEDTWKKFIKFRKIGQG